MNRPDRMHVGSATFRRARRWVLVALCASLPTAFAKDNAPADPVQAPAWPGKGAPVSTHDRVYTADQSSNTVSIINPATNQVLGTIALGEARVDGVLGPFDDDQVNVHGLGFSRDGTRLNVLAVNSNAAMLIDTGTNRLLQTTYLRRAPHEGFVSSEGTQLWVAERGVDTVAVIDIASHEVIARVQTGKNPSKVVFSPNGRYA